MAMTDPPPLPTRKQAGFSDLFSAWLTWFTGVFITELNAVIQAFNLNSLNSTSTTSNLISVGSKSFTASTGKSYLGGMYVIIADAAAPSTNSMYGQVTSYNSVTGALVVNIENVVGTGTKTSWVISFTAPGGATNTYVNTAIATATQTLRTLASAATPDIWASVEFSIIISGTSTITGFTAAAQAGARRNLIAGGAFSITVGANVIMEGWPSGTYKFAVNDRIEVIALTTTQFLLKVTRADGGTLAAIGVGFDWNHTSTPAYGLIADGSAVSRTTYANLFARIATVHGAGDGSTTFNLPSIPADYTTVQSSSSNEGTASQGVVKNHTHPVYANTGATSNASQAAISVANTGSSSQTGNNVSGGAANLAAGTHARKCVYF